MALPGLFPIYPDPIPMLYQVSLSLPMPEPSKISLSIGVTASNPFLVPNVDFLQNFIKGDIGIADKMMKESMFKTFNDPIAQKDEKVFKKFAKLTDSDIPDVNKYKKDGKIKLPKEDVKLPPMEGIGFKGFEKTLLTSIFETQKPYFEVAKLVIGNIAKIEDIVARVMPLLGVPLSTKSLKPVGNIGTDNRPKAVGYKGAEELKVALSKLQKFSKEGSIVNIDKNGNATRDIAPLAATASLTEGLADNKNWQIVSTVYSTGVFKSDVEYKYIYIDLPPTKETPEEVSDLNLEDDDPYNKYKPERIILGVFRADGTPLNPNEILKTVGLSSNNTVDYIDTPFKRAEWILRSPKWKMYNIFPNNQITLAEPIRNVFPSLGSPTFTWERGGQNQNSKTKPEHNPPAQEWKVKKYKKGDKNLINNEDAIENSPVIVGFDSTDTSSHQSFFTDIVKYKMYQQGDVADFSNPSKLVSGKSEKNQVANEIVRRFNVMSHVENVYSYGQSKASVYREINGKPAFPDLMRMSFKPFRFYTNDAKYDDKITSYNNSQNIPEGYIWIDPEADYEMKVIRVDPTTNIEFEEAKGEAEVKSNIKSFIKNKASFSISTGEQFNFDISKNSLPAESFNDITEYVIENWNYNSDIALSPEKRIENNNTYNISAWSKIPVRKYKDLKGRTVLKRELIGGNKLQDFISGENNLLLVYEFVNDADRYYYRKYKWVMTTSQIIVMGLIGIAAPTLLIEMVALYENNPNASWKFEVKAGDIIDKIDDLLEHARDAFSKTHTIKFSIPWPGGEKDYEWTYSIKEMLSKIYDLIPIGDSEVVEEVSKALRAPLIKLLNEIEFSYEIRLKDFFPYKVYIPIENGVQFLKDDRLTGSETKTRIYLENDEIKKWYYIYDKNLVAGTENDSLPTFGLDKKIIINYESDPEKDGGNEGDLNITSSSINIPLYRIKAENDNFPYGKVIDPSKITNDILTKDELYSKGVYGAGGKENPQKIEVIKRYMLTDLDTESYYIIEGVLADKNKQTVPIGAGSGAGGSGASYYKLPHAIGAAKVFLSMLVDIFSKLIPMITKLLALFKNPASFVTEILKEKLGEGFSIFSKDSFKAFDRAKDEEKNLKDKKPSERTKKMKEIFKDSPLSNHVFINKKGDYKFLLDGLAMLPFELFGQQLPFGMEMNFDDIKGTPIKLITKANLPTAKVKNLQAFLKPSLKSFKGPGSDGVAAGLNLSDLKSMEDPIYKSNLNNGKTNPNDFEVVDVKYSTGTFINGVNYNYIYITQDTDKVLSTANNIVNTPDESVSLKDTEKSLEALNDELKKDPTNKAIKDMLGKLKNKVRGLNDTSQPLLKMLLGFVTLPIKIVAGIIEWLMSFFKSLTNPLTLPAKIVELLSFSWLMKFFTPIGILELAGIKFKPELLATWLGLVKAPNIKPPNISPKIPDGVNLPELKYYKDASPKGKFLIPDDYEIADLNQVLSMPFMPKLPTYTARQFRENPTRPVKLVFPMFCLFEKIINGIIDFIWSTLGLEALIPAPHIKLCKDTVNPDINDAVELGKELKKEGTEPVKTETGSNDIDPNAGFLYDITLDDGTVVSGLNYEQLQKYVKDHEDIGYDFKF